MKTNWDMSSRPPVQSGHKAFDAQADLIMTGNVLACTQHSLFIRPASETECNGMTFPPGHLQRFDCGFWRRTGTPARVIERACELANREGRSVILYRFFHRAGERRIDHGHLITTGEYSPKRLLARFITPRRRKSRQVIEAAIPYITDSRPSPHPVKKDQHGT